VVLSQVVSAKSLISKSQATYVVSVAEISLFESIVMLAQAEYVVSIAEISLLASIVMLAQAVYVGPQLPVSQSYPVAVFVKICQTLH
jgi:hypothetical protein